MARIIGFEFLIEPVDGAAVWVRLQGSGGKIGAGSLAAINHAPQTSAGRTVLIQEVAEHSLRCAKHEASETGAVRVSREHDDPAQRIVKTPVRAVLACRAIEDTTP